MMKNKKWSTLIVFVVICIWSTGTVSAQDKMPSREERIHALSHIWKEMQYNFVYPETLQKVNIDSLYRAYLPKVEQVKSNYEYYRILCAFMAHFNEGHTRIWADTRPDAPPPLTTGNLYEHIFVSNIAKSMADKVPIGSEIIKINRIPVIKFLKDSVYPYISAANPTFKFDKAVNEMLYGVPKSAVKITVITPTGKEAEVEMIRGVKEEMANNTPVSPITIKIMDGDIGYIRLPSFHGKNIETIDSVFVDAVPQLKKCKGLIVDIRGNRGGANRSWMLFAACLYKDINLQGKWFFRKNVATEKMWGRMTPKFNGYASYIGTAMEEFKAFPITTNIPDSLQLHQPVIVISGQLVASASEVFLSVMKESQRATILGEPSAGCLDELIYFPLPGIYEVWISAKKYVNPDGTQSNKTGVLPDIVVKRDYLAYRKGKDNVLERAIEEIRKM